MVRFSIVSMVSIVSIVVACGHPAPTKIVTAPVPIDAPVAPPIDAVPDAAPDAALVIDAPPPAPAATFVSLAPPVEIAKVEALGKLGPTREVAMGITRDAAWTSLAGRTWKDAAGKPFVLTTVVFDDPAAMREAYATGKIAIATSTVGELPLWQAALGRDARVAPRVGGLAAWSTDLALVARHANVKLADLIGKTIVVVPASAAHIFALELFALAEIDPATVTWRFVATEAEIAAALASEPTIEAAVIHGAAPAGTSVVIETRAAARLVAHVWFSRADFTAANPGIVTAIARGFGDPTSRTMLLDRASITGFARRYAAALAQLAKLKLVGVLRGDVIDPIVAKLPVVKSPARTPLPPGHGEPAPIIVPLRIAFFPNSFDLRHATDGKPTEPDLDKKIRAIAEVVQLFPGTHIVISGHTDNSMKGIADESLVRDLSKRRAEAVLAELVTKYKIPADQLGAIGMGWDRPVDPKDPDNHQRNRRIDIEILPD